MTKMERKQFFIYESVARHRRKCWNDNIQKRVTFADFSIARFLSSSSAFSGTDGDWKMWCELGIARKRIKIHPSTTSTTTIFDGDEEELKIIFLGFMELFFSCASSACSEIESGGDIYTNYEGRRQQPFFFSQPERPTTAYAYEWLFNFQALTHTHQILSKNCLSIFQPICSPFCWDLMFFGVSWRFERSSGGKRIKFWAYPWARSLIYTGIEHTTATLLLLLPNWLRDLLRSHASSSQKRGRKRLEK